MASGARSVHLRQHALHVARRVPDAVTGSTWSIGVAVGARALTAGAVQADSSARYRPVPGPDAPRRRDDRPKLGGHVVSLE